MDFKVSCIQSVEAAIGPLAVDQPIDTRQVRHRHTTKTPLLGWAFVPNLVFLQITS